MKLCAVLLLAAFLQVSANGYSQKITLSAKNVPLKSVFQEIERQSGYYFLYYSGILEQTKKVDIDIKDGTVEEVLKACLKGQPFDYEIMENKLILIKKKEEASKKRTPLTLSTDTIIDVKGKVTDASGNLLPGATIIAKGAKVGTVTDENGEFLLPNVSLNTVWIIRSVGYKERKITAREKNIIVQLDVVVSDLDETVIKGYYSTTKRFNTGAVSKVTSDVISKQPLGDPILALQGRVPGLQIAQSSGVPGSLNVIRLRGINSIANGNDPLYVIDGVPFTSTTLTNQAMIASAQISPFSSINPSDIESIEILKDADATAIYGSRGANGVILITTKKGKAGKTAIDVDFYMGEGRVTRTAEFLNTRQYLQMRHEAFRNDQESPGPTDYDVNGEWDTTRYTDWQKVMIGGSSRITNTQLRLSGGNDLTQFSIGSNYRRETTVFQGDYVDKKASVFINIVNNSSNNKFRAVLSASYLNDNSLLPTSDFTRNIINLAPNAPSLYDNNGNLNWQNNTWQNPMAELLRKSKSVTNNIIGNLNLLYRILPGLNLKTTLGYNHIFMDQSMTVPLSSYPPEYAGLTSLRVHDFASNHLKTWNIEPQISFNRDLFGGNFDVLVGMAFQQSLQNAIGQRAADFSSDALIENILAATSVSAFNMNYTQYRYTALFGRLNYTWKEKYMMNLTARRDGSTRFGPGKRFGNFGAVGMGWIFSNEPFMNQVKPLMSFGKLRASYGTTGNDQLGDYQYLSTYSSNGTPYLGVVGLFPSRLANQNYSWEMVKKFELGLELGFLNDRILFTGDYYRNRTDNQLVGYSLSTITGFDRVQANLPAVIQNTGLEFDLITKNIQTNDFTWTSSINLSIPRNKLVAYPNLQGSSYANQYEVGKPLFVAKRFHYIGVDPKTGVYQFEDINKDSEISSPEDRVALKQISQNYFGGFQNSITYKGLQLDFFIQFVKQTGIIFFYNGTPGTISRNQPKSILNRWDEPGDVAYIQKFTQSFSSDAARAQNQFTNGDGRIGDASFVRLKNIALSYKIPFKLRQVLRLRDSKIYIQCRNLLTITNYQGFDPEVQSLAMLPPLRIITAGIQISL